MSKNNNTNTIHPHMASKNDIIVGLDIGTTKICAIVGQLAENGKINVLGMGKAASAGGVSRGMVANIRKAEVAIREAVEEAQRQSQVAIKNVFVGIAGHHIRSMQHRGTLSRRMPLRKSAGKNSTNSNRKCNTLPWNRAWKSCTCCHKTTALMMRKA